VDGLNTTQREATRTTRAGAVGRSGAR